MEVDEVGEFVATDLKIIGYVAFVDIEEEQLICFAHQFLWFVLGILHSLEVKWKQFNVSIFG